jgi:hypothetical protein
MSNNASFVIFHTLFWWKNIMVTQKMVSNTTLNIISVATLQLEKRKKTLGGELF